MAHAAGKVKYEREAESAAVLRQWPPPMNGATLRRGWVLGPGPAKHLAKRMHGDKTL